MKKLLSIFLVLCITLLVPVQAKAYTGKTLFGSALLAGGFSTAYLAGKLWSDYTKERTKLKKLNRELLNANSFAHDNRENINHRSNLNLLRKFGSYATGAVSFSSTAAGLALLAYQLYQK